MSARRPPLPAAPTRVAPAPTRATMPATAAATPSVAPPAPTPSLPTPALAVSPLAAFSKIFFTLLPIMFERSTTIPQIIYEKLTIIAVTINFGRRRLIP